MKTVPSWVGKKTHTWESRIGGGIWYQAQNIIQKLIPILKEYSKPVLLGLRSDVKQEGYRFDLDTWAPNAEGYSYWPDRCSAECVMKTLEGANAEFMWSMPTPNKFSTDPYKKGGPAGMAYPWQTAEYYAAYLQYMLGSASHAAPKIIKQRAIPFFTDATCTKINERSEELVGNNWANLRAKRGRLAPYPIKAVILGIEPYGDAQEAMKVYGADSGRLYGETVMRFRKAIRARGIKIPLGLNIAGFYPMSDFQRPWFKPLFDVLGEFASDFSYLDMDHLYHFGVPSNEQNRIFPTMESAAGWQNHWIPKTEWKADYTKRLWMWEDVRVALRQIGEDPNRWKLGCSEHGMAPTSQFTGNDMGAGIHWGLWLAECMRCNVQWDMNWVFVDLGFSHAQIQVRDGKVTRTPGHYVYKLAQQLIGLDHHDNWFKSPTVATGIDNGAAYTSPDLLVRVFRDPGNQAWRLFVINKHPTNAAVITGWEKWIVSSWRILKANSFEAMNPLGNHNPLDPWHPETVKTFENPHVHGQALTIPAISVNMIEVR